MNGRILLDTNIYGEIILRQEEEEVFKGIIGKALVIYGADVIRKELRDTSTKKAILTKEKSRSLRMLLLQLYDSLVRGRQLATVPFAQRIAEECIGSLDATLQKQRRISSS